MGADDSYDLKRFTCAQTGIYARALSELRAGDKRSHWMWFIFPQVYGLGSTPTASRYAIKSLAETRAYIEHPDLGPRLVECAEALCAVEGRSALQIFGSPDDLKLWSSMTLFAWVAGVGSVFVQVLDKYYGGERDEHTLAFLNAMDEH